MKRLLLFFAAVCLFAQVDLHSTFNAQQKLADQVTWGIITSHPEPEVSVQLVTWLRNGTVRLAIQTSQDNGNAAEEISSDVMNIQGKPTPVLVVNPVFMTSNKFRTGESTNEKEVAYRQLALYHEYWHLKKFVEGEGPVLNGPYSVQEKARRYLEEEMDVVRKEWMLAKKIHRENLVLGPATSQFVQMYGEERGLRKAMFVSLKEQYQNTPKAQYISYWEKLTQ